MQSSESLKEIAKVFFRLGCIGFGGPAVHIALMDKEIVKKRKWVSEDQFMDAIGTTNLVPGPNSTEMTMHFGQEKGGWKGLIVAGFCFITPAVITTMLFAWLYQRYGKLPQIEPFIYGIMPAVIAIMVELMFNLGKKAIRSVPLLIIALIAAALALFDINEIYILFGAGFLGMIIYYASARLQSLNAFVPLILWQIPAFILDNSSWKIFWVFLKIGAILYGSGYVLYAFFDAEFVKTGILTKQQLIDAIAIGQLTPGPVFSSATFVGWQIGGFQGAVLASVGIFLPSFLFIAFLGPILPRLKKSKLFSAFLETANAVSIALIFAVCIQMGKTAIKDWRTIIIAITCLAVILLFKKLNKAFVIFGGALLGYLLTLV